MTAIITNLFKSLFSALPFVLLCISSFEARADFNCIQEVTYKWVKKDKQESVIHWGTYQQLGVDEPAAKEALEKIVTRERKRASEACRDLHENLAQCIATKYGSHQSELSVMDFTARKTLHEAISSDCKEQQGNCLEIAASEAKCVEKVKVEPEGEKKDDKGKKDDKAKKKK